MNIFIVFATLISAACAEKIVSRIVGGDLAEDGRFPYEVSLKYFGRHECGGSIINDQWILTAGHCVDELEITDLTVQAGSNTLDRGGKIYQVAKYIVHEEYMTDMITAVNDIAVIKLKTKITFSSKIQPIPISRENTNPGDELIASGWGRINYPGIAPNGLKYLKLKAIDQKSCQKRFKQLEYKVYDTQLCVFSRNGEGICSGDSGSPLVQNGKVAGIASWVEPCGIGYPDVFTRVSKFVQWIEDKIKNN